MLRCGVIRIQATLFGLVCALTGCAQLFGLDETSGGDAGPLPPGQVSLTIERLSVGARNVIAPQSLTGLAASWLVADATAPGGLREVDATAAGSTWTAELELAAPVVFELPDVTPVFPRLYDLPTTTIKTLHGVMEHPNPEPAPADAMVQVSVNLDAAYTGTEGYLLYTAGAWNQIGLSPTAVGDVVLAPAAFRYDSMTSITGRPHERLTTADAAVVLRYLGNQLTGAVEMAPVEQTAALALTGTMAPVAIDQTLALTVDLAAAAARYATVRPAVGGIQTGWSVRAAPGALYGNDNGPLLQAGGVLAGETTVSSTYGNPFAARGWPAYLTWSTFAGRVATGRDGLQVTLNAGMYQREAPRAANDLQLPAGLPELITLDGTPLSTDGMTVPRPARAVEVTFITDRSDQTIYQLEVFEMVPSPAEAPTSLVRRYALTALGVAPRFTLPASVFKPGSQYTLRAISIARGFTAVAAGDLTQREQTIAVAYLDSGMFEVAP